MTSCDIVSHQYQWQKQTFDFSLNISGEMWPNGAFYLLTLISNNILCVEKSTT